MERKIRNATAKLRNLKDYLSSTRNLNQQGQGPASTSSSTNPYQHHHHQRKSSKESVTGNGMPLSVSLFDLVEPCSRPTSMAFSNSFTEGGLRQGTFHQNPNTSVSMYGLSSAEILHSPGKAQQGEESSIVRPVTSTSKNPAIRLFYTIRSKFRKRRDRGSKAVDSKCTDFGPFMSGRQSEQYGSDAVGGPSSSSHYLHLDTSQSVDQLHYLGGGFEDDTFNSPLGCRDRSYGNKENTAPRLTTSASCFVINDDNNCQRPATAAYDMNQMDQSSSIPPSLPPPRNRPNILSHPRPECTPALPQPSTSTGPLVKAITPGSPNKVKGLTKELFDLIHYGWYWGGLSKEEAEEKLRNEPDGAFIVRDSSSSVHILSLSFNSKGKTKHTRIDYVDGKFCFLTSETEAFPSVAELIDYWIKNSEQGIFCYSKSNRSNGPSSYPVRLLKPISRFTEVKSLQFLSSFVLYQYTRLDLIPKLPLPPQLIEFIGQQQYF